LYSLQIPVEKTIMGRPPIFGIRMTPTETQRRWRAKRKAAAEAALFEQLKATHKLRPQSSHGMDVRGRDPYFTGPEAVVCVMALERAFLPRVILDPCAGAGAFTIGMARHGYETHANDIVDYGLPGCQIADYLTMAPWPGIEAVVTNPPDKMAARFLEKARGECGYVALLLRAMWLADARGRGALLERHPPSRVWHLGRLPMMHRHGYSGPKAASNTPHSLVVWDNAASHVEPPRRIDWRGIWDDYQAGRLALGPTPPAPPT
jgi:hypothetical protein